MFEEKLTLEQIRLKDPEHEWKYNNQWFMFHSDMPMVLTPRATG